MGLCGNITSFCLCCFAIFRYFTKKKKNKKENKIKQAQHVKKGTGYSFVCNTLDGTFKKQFLQSKNEQIEVNVFTTEMTLRDM